MLRAPASDTSCFYDILRAAASGTSNDKLLYEVRWLEWEVFGSNSYLPPFNLHLPKLSVLMLWGSGFTQDWKEWSSFMASKRLKILVFKYSPNLRSTPDLSAFTQLKILKFSGCWELEHLHPSIGKLTTLPSAIGSLRKLEKLSGCRSLREIPSSIGDLQNLQHLDLKVWDRKTSK
ncbi:disease resistance protein RPV1-like [Eucalyptus grandis]|uniref:disease resistance protein RPV1-like n=1 Tax=Eucalyptus grandis TaxID=71139 RepID=UPI00192EE918|nr:disease resistance protein RPV1-like [Eucalyptus grandis]